MTETYFDQLGISPTSDIGQIEIAYQKRRSEWKGNPVRLGVIEQAYRVLGNPISLKKYLKDMSLVESPKASLPYASTAPGERLSNPSVPRVEVPNQPARKRHSTEFIQADESLGITAPSPSDGKKGTRKKTEIFDPETIIAHPVGTGAEFGVLPAAAPKRRRTEIIEDVQIAGPGSLNPAAGIEKRLETHANQTPYPPPEKPGRLFVDFDFGGEHMEYDLKEGQNIIGRPPLHGALPDIPMPDTELFISRCHATVTVEGTKVTLVDSSSNGTFLNGQLIQTSQPFLLKNMDVIEIEKRRLVIHIP